MYFKYEKYTLYVSSASKINQLLASWAVRATYRNPVRVFLPDFLSLWSPLLKRMLLFILELHRSSVSKAAPELNVAGERWCLKAKRDTSTRSRVFLWLWAAAEEYNNKGCVKECFCNLRFRRDLLWLRVSLSNLQVFWKRQPNTTTFKCWYLCFIIRLRCRHYFVQPQSAESYRAVIRSVFMLSSGSVGGARNPGLPVPNFPRFSNYFGT